VSNNTTLLKDLLLETSAL